MNQSANNQFLQKEQKQYIYELSMSEVESNKLTLKYQKLFY